MPTRDENDDPADWKTLALDAIADLRAYALDETPERRIVSAEAYERIAEELSAREEAGAS